MPFTAKPAKYNACIHAVTIGTGEKAITIGGEGVMPFCTFDAPIAHVPKTGIEITDLGMEAEPECVQKYYEGCMTPADMAEKAGTFDGVDFLSLRLEGGDPNGDNRTVEELAAVVRDVADSTKLPLVVCGCGHPEKDAALLSECAKILAGKNALFLSAREENYQELGEEIGIHGGQLIGAESSVDINLAKQLNVLLLQQGVAPDRIVMDIGSAAAGYGFEYLISALDRIRTAALAQGDTTLQMPIITPVTTEVWQIKETMASEADMPEWGSLEERCIDMEIETAAAMLVSGSDAVIVKHPETVKTLAKLIGELI